MPVLGSVNCVHAVRIFFCDFEYIVYICRHIRLFWSYVIDEICPRMNLYKKVGL